MWPGVIPLTLPMKFHIRHCSTSSRRRQVMKNFSEALLATSLYNQKQAHLLKTEKEVNVLT